MLKARDVRATYFLRSTVTTRRKWRQVTVVGCGLIGSSFALALKRAQMAERVLGLDTSASVLDEARARGVIDDVDDALSVGGVSTSDLVYLATPVLEIVRFMGERLVQTKPGAIITDAGSTKRLVCRAATEHFPPDRYFIGGHPIAGSHQSGVNHARADLFKEATYVLTTDNSPSQSESFNRVRETVEALGCRVKLMTAVGHDRALALVSHLPQLVSSALAKTVNEQDDAATLLALAGPGYKDMTRLADSSWLMWRDVLVSNPAEIATALDLIIEKLGSFRDELKRFEARDNAEFDLLRQFFRDEPF